MKLFTFSLLDHHRMPYYLNDTSTSKLHTKPHVTSLKYVAPLNSRKPYAQANVLKDCEIATVFLRLKC